MKTLKFATNISSNEAVEKIKTQLNESDGIVEWNIDLNDPGKILTIRTVNLSSEKISRIISSAGFKNQEITPGWKKISKRLFTKSCCD